MKTYKDLNEAQKNLFNKIEGFFLSDKAIQQKDFICVLGVLINKFKFHTRILKKSKTRKPSAAKSMK